MRTSAEMHALKNNNLVQATPSSITVIDVVVLGSITSRCSENGKTKRAVEIDPVVVYLFCLSTKPVLLLVFVFSLTQSNVVFVFPQKPPPPPPQKKSSMIMNLSVHNGCVRLV